jgi:hypothetical protein
MASPTGECHAVFSPTLKLRRGDKAARPRKTRRLSEGDSQMVQRLTGTGLAVLCLVVVVILVLLKVI